MTTTNVRLRRATKADAAAVAMVYVTSWNEGFGDLAPPRRQQQFGVASQGRQPPGIGFDGGDGGQHLHGPGQHGG